MGRDAQLASAIISKVIYKASKLGHAELITALHGMQTRSSDEKAVCPAVCPSVCLSVKRVHRDKTEERSVQIFTPYER